MKYFLGAIFWLVAWLLIFGHQPADQASSPYLKPIGVALAILPLLFGVRLVYQSVIALLAVSLGAWAIVMGAADASIVDFAIALAGCAILGVVALLPNKVLERTANPAIFQVLAVGIVAFGIALIETTSAGFILFGLWICLCGFAALWFVFTRKPFPSSLNILGVVDANKP